MYRVQYDCKTKHTALIRKRLLQSLSKTPASTEEVRTSTDDLQVRRLAQQWTQDDAKPVEKAQKKKKEKGGKRKAVVKDAESVCGVTVVVRY